MKPTTVRQTPDLPATVRDRLARGEHEAVASELAAAGQLAVAAWILEEIWEFEGAWRYYDAAKQPLDALRCAVELGHSKHIDTTMQQFIAAPQEIRDQAIALLRSRGRDYELLQLLAANNDDPAIQAEVMLRSGDRVGAAQVLASAGRPREALQALGTIDDLDAAGLACAAQMHWDLGAADTCVRLAQAAWRRHNHEAGPAAPVPETLVSTLACGLAALGHDLAASLVLQAGGVHQIAVAQAPGRYRIVAPGSACFAGVAYEGFDGVSQREVEVHLLLAEDRAADDATAEVRGAVARFAHRAEAAAALGHLAIRPVLHFDVEAGLLILPHADGPPLRSLIHPPGMPLARARALVAFMLEGLAAAHGQGLAHGSLLPTQIVADALGRPLLGPFGADEIAGLAATRTGALEELLALTAPERRSGAGATSASDIFSIGALLVALHRGHFATTRDQLTPIEAVLVGDALNPDPSQRPDADTLLSRLGQRLVDIRDLGTAAINEAAPEPSPDLDRLMLQGITVDVADTWSPAALDELLACDAPRLQSVLTQHHRKVVLAAWPEGCQRVPEKIDCKGLLGFLDDLSPSVQASLKSRVRSSDWVYTPGGAWILALDGMLTR